MRKAGGCDLAGADDWRPRLSCRDDERRSKLAREDSGVTTTPSSRVSPLTCLDLQNELRHFAKHTLQPQLLELASRLHRDLLEELRSPDAANSLYSSTNVDNASGEGSQHGSRSPTRAECAARSFVKGSRASLSRMSRSQLLAMALQEESVCDEGSSGPKAANFRRQRDQKAKVLKVLPAESPSATNNLEAPRPVANWQRSVQSVVRNVWFEKMVSLAITVNAVYVACATEYMSTHELEAAPTSFRVIEAVFLVVFSTEMALRFLVQRLGLFRARLPDGSVNESFYWNILDFTVITLQVVELFLTAAQSQVLAFSGLSVVRLLRLVRLVRIVRVVKVMRSVRDLRMILYSIWRSVGLFLWALLALMLLNFMCSVYFTEYALVEKLRGDRPLKEELDVYFGSFLRTMLSLFMAITGGIDWGDLSAILSGGELSFVIVPFALYVAFSTIAMLNVVSGIILETAMEIARDEKEVWVVRNARVVFDRLDHNKDGTITLQDFMKSLHHPHMIRFFQSMRIEMSEAQALFDLLDMSGDGSVSANEFLNGCIRVRGPAKALDLLILSREVSQLFEAHASGRALSRKGTLRRQRASLCSTDFEDLEGYETGPLDLVGMLRRGSKRASGPLVPSHEGENVAAADAATMSEEVADAVTAAAATETDGPAPGEMPGAPEHEDDMLC